MIYAKRVAENSKIANFETRTILKIIFYEIPILMLRKLIALLILLGTLGFIVGLYLYFFVYYTGSLEVQTNTSGYDVNLFSLGTAQSRSEFCETEICVITNIAPFEYTLTVSKKGYESYISKIDIHPGGKDQIIFELKKEISLTPLSEEIKLETAQEKITRLRQESTSFARFQIDEESVLRFAERDNTLELFFISRDGEKKIRDFSPVSEQDIKVESIMGTHNIFLALEDKYYIFEPQIGRITELDFTLEILYIKAGNIPAEYLIITDKGAFVYNIQTGRSEFQYLFQDYVITQSGNILGIIRDSETQKKQNFNLKNPGNLVVEFNPDTKIRKVLYTTDKNIERIEQIGQDIILTIDEKKYILENY